MFLWKLHFLLFSAFVGVTLSGDEETGEILPASVPEARARVRLLETVYLATLQAMHSRYFDGNDRAPVPSGVLEEVFRRVDFDHKTRSRWISVNTPAMDPKHEPTDAFSKEISLYLKANNNRYEKVVDEKYVSARAITLFSRCQKCHLSALSQQNGGRKVAGLVIEIPPRKTAKPSK